MKLYLLQRDLSGRPIYDTQDIVVIRAVSESSAREIANENSGDEGKIWFDSTKTSCEVLIEDGEPGIVCRDFHEG